MDWNQVQACWKHVRGKVKAKWVRLTEEDLSAIGGRRQRLEDKIRERYGFATPHIREELEDWVRCQQVTRRRPSRKTKLALPTIRRQTSFADAAVTAIVIPSKGGSWADSRCCEARKKQSPSKYIGTTQPLKKGQSQAKVHPTDLRVLLGTCCSQRCR